jgi:hypothetical protein
MGNKSTVAVSAGVIETTISGMIGPALIRAEWAAFEELGGARTWIFLADAVTGYDPSSLDIFTDILRVAAAKLGLKACYVVSSNPMLRMSIGLLTVKSGVPFGCVATQGEARALAAKVV